MAATYSWHPRVDLTAPLWPCAQPILEDELMSSWLVRTALAHGCSPLTLTNSVWPRWRAWSTDLDRGMGTVRAAQLAHLAGCATTDIEACSLAAASRLITSTRKTTLGTLPWLLARGSRNLRCAGGLQICPRCFSQSIPYYRINARLAWHVACPLHLVRLVDRCPNCCIALQPHRLTPPADSCAHCHQCGVALADAPVVPMTHAEFGFQLGVDHHLQKYASGDTQITPQAWLYQATRAISFLRAAARHHSASTERALASLGISMTSLPISGLCLEMLSVADRARLLGYVCVIMTTDQEQLAELLKECPVSCTSFYLQQSTAALSARTLRAQTNVNPSHERASGPPNSPLAVQRMWIRLWRRFLRDK
ncbi:TniQ family protein [Pseudomonas viridiflava]|uniref:TniQ family protein n=1 Tax=Pseudomonas viridiflava TaxID=33069 RepID=UPI00387EE342